ncbi:ArnT family glycosyltransferase [Methyloradius palustris]|uniref:Glycosyl hydrolase n=1 Tax=Methyloradius palustris TaxID=2778876 RepID=A0A8D5JYI5_9PROT|nr:glycosyltransferase family 39 protein [Methyloradius palustris]BCM24732.1 glycosyl hydrolase [Methyloradius palustris]
MQNAKLTNLLLWALAAIIMIWGIGHVPLTDVDEGAFAEASREMLSRGDFISPWLLDAPRFDKPALIHWLQIASMQVFGINAFGARLPSALAGLLWLFVVAQWSKDIAARVGVSGNARYFGLLIAMTSIAVPAISRVATADALLNGLLAVSLYFLWRALLAVDDASLKKYGRLTAIFIALGLLTKGPIAVLVPAAASFLTVLVVPSRFKNWRKVAFDPIAWTLVIGIALPWYVLQYQAQGMAFIQGFFGKHNLGRYTGTMLGFSGGFWYYPAWMLVSLLPWIPLLFRTLAELLFKRSSPLRQSVATLLWVLPLFVLVFFSFSATKLPHYGFYGLTGLFVMMALTLAIKSNPIEVTKPSPLLVDRLWISALLTVFVCTHLWAGKLSSLTSEPYYKLVLENAGAMLVQHADWSVGIAALGIALLLLPQDLIKRIAGLHTIPSNAWRLGAGAVSFAICLHLIFVPTVIAALRAPILNAALEVRAIQTPVVSWQLSAPSLSFSAQRVIPSQEPKPGDTVVMFEKHHQQLMELLATKYAGVSVTQLWHEGGVEIVKLSE